MLLWTTEVLHDSQMKKFGFSETNIFNKHTRNELQVAILLDSGSGSTFRYHYSIFSYYFAIYKQ